MADDGAEGELLARDTHAKPPLDLIKGFALDQPTFDSDRLSNYPIGPHVEWLRIGIVSGDPSVFYVSTDGTEWVEVFSESQSGFLTYSQVGLCLHVNRNGGSSFPVAGSQQSIMNVYYYSDPDLSPGF
jgi:hypothetical protein